MLTRDDLLKLTQIVQSETRKTVHSEVKIIVEKEMRKMVREEIYLETQPIQNDISQLKKDLKRVGAVVERIDETTKGLDKEFSRRVLRIENKLQLTPFQQ